MSEPPHNLAPNLTLVGMPGSGKSTVGRLIAERLGWAFLDGDREIERIAGMALWQIVEAEGQAGLARREEDVNASLACERTVIAPGGSVVYFERAMRNLKSLGTIVYLAVPPDVLERRAGDLKARAVMIRPGMNFVDLIAERDPLYRRWADAVIECGRDRAARVAERALTAVAMVRP